MAATEEQLEEIEVLHSIFGDDETFVFVKEGHFQVKFGPDGTHESLLMDFSFTAEYPAAAPNVSLDGFYNRNLAEDFRSKIVQMVLDETENWLGMPMMFTLVEYLRSQMETLEFPRPGETLERETKEEKVEEAAADSGKISQPKESMTKQQKRRFFDKFGAFAEKPRGHDWIDIISHLSKTADA